VTFGKKEEAIFLGREIAQHRDYSDETARQIDAEVKALIEEAHQEAMRVLKKHKDELIKVAEILLERETLSGEEMDLILAGREDELPPLLRTKDVKSKAKRRYRKVKKKAEEPPAEAEPEVSPAG